jgi:hypothetical protein
MKTYWQSTYTKFVDILPGDTVHGYTNTSSVCQTVAVKLPCGGVIDGSDIDREILKIFYSKPPEFRLRCSFSCTLSCSRLRSYT